jgi:SAM-dependent methyltransferase
MMGFDCYGTRFLLDVKARGDVDFSRVATIGRQGMHVSPDQLRKNLKDCGWPSSCEDVDRVLFTKCYAEPFLRMLGAKEVESFDISAYERATVIHDFNDPVEARFLESFSLVIDSGSLEHVFNFPQAIANCMRMVKVGGHFLGIVPANNQCGHGFYQFSPELFFRVFDEPSGFKIKDFGYFEYGDEWGQLKELVDPKVSGAREELRTVNWTYLVIVAQKLADMERFPIPQQSDYVTAWKK